MFHILNGESTAASFERSRIPGEYISWREDLMTGCATESAQQSIESWLSLRAEALTAAFNLDFEECRAELFAQEAKLESSLASDEIVLWFEYDMFCQINLVYLFNWFERHAARLPRITIPTSRSLLERGLGTLIPDDFTELFRDREVVSTKLLDLGSEVWRAYSSSDPTGLVALLNVDEGVLPYLRRSISCHLSRFPSLENGLGRVENTALGLIASGQQSFGELFSAFWKSEGAFGYGDSHFFNALKSLISCRMPLLSTNIPTEFANQDDSFIKSIFALTEAGHDVLRGRADHVVINGIDQFLGGAHLELGSYWRWDANKQTLRKAGE